MVDVTLLLTVEESSAVVSGLTPCSKSALSSRGEGIQYEN